MPGFTVRLGAYDIPSRRSKHVCSGPVRKKPQPPARCFLESLATTRRECPRAERQRRQVKSLGGRKAHLDTKPRCIVGERDLRAVQFGDGGDEAQA